MRFEKTRSEAQKLRSSEGKLYLPVILLWLLTIIISPQVTMGENVKKYEDNISITIVPDETVQNSGVADCAEQYVFNQYVQQLHCIFACDWNANLFGYFPSGQAILKQSIERDYTQVKEAYGIRSTNFGNFYEFEIRVNQHVEITIKTFDVLGHLIDTKGFDCHVGYNKILIDNQNLINGVYFHTIEINKVLIKSEKFIKY